MTTKVPMGIAVNREKSRVVPLDKPFRFCKARYKLTETGAVKVKGSRDSGPRSYRKLRALLAKHQAGQIDRRAVDDYYQSQIAYFEKYDDHILVATGASLYSLRIMSRTGNDPASLLGLV